MSDTSQYRYVPGVSEVGDIDLDRTVIHDQNGRRVTEAVAEAEFRAALTRRRNLIPGAKSLSGGSVHSPRLHVVVSTDTERQIRARAAQQHMSVSRWLRTAIEKQLAG
ncbi:MAG: DNA-binding protein [Propionibacteriaceae bacterium]|jgi:hypothetical protein|nr:DNA-binding protein [Propionibacteriaceae bacterium]